MLTQTLSDFPTDYIGVTPLDRHTSAESSNEQAGSFQVSLEWIQSLPQELKDEALLRLCKTVETKTTMKESGLLRQPTTLSVSLILSSC